MSPEPGESARTAALPWTPVKIGWLSGVSRPGTNALSDEQRTFVEALPGPPEWKLRTNFPYGAPMNEGAERFRPTPLVLASLVNLARFTAASLPFRSPASLAHWRALRASCDQLLLVTGSCGSQIVTALERPVPATSPLRILSLGPVDWGCAGLNQTRVRGARDPVRTPVGRRRDTLVPGVGHMDYARSREVREIAARWVEQALVP